MNASKPRWYVNWDIGWRLVFGIAFNYGIAFHLRHRSLVIWIGPFSMSVWHETEDSELPVLPLHSATNLHSVDSEMSEFSLIQNDPIDDRFYELNLSPFQRAEAIKYLMTGLVIISDSKNKTWCCAKPTMEFEGALAALNLLK